MDQEDSEEKIDSENDEWDWMKAKKFWKPGRVDHPLWPLPAAPHGPPLFQRPFVSSPGLPALGWGWGVLSYPTLSLTQGKKSQDLPPWSHLSLPAHLPRAAEPQIY